jgi:hypothetical protein
MQQVSGMTSDPALPVDAVIVAEIELSPEEMMRIQEEAEAIDNQRRQLLDGLAHSIEDKWKRASSDRNMKEEEWRRAMRLLLGNKSSSRGSTLNTQTTTESSRARPDHNLVSEKCKIAEAQIWSQQFSGGDKNWDIKPSPRPDVDPALAAQASRALEQEIYDQLSATKYGPKARQAISDMVRLGTGILKGPVPSLKPKRVYQSTQAPDGTLVAIPTYETIPAPEVYRVDPWMFYPDTTVNDICDAEWALEIHPMSKTQFGKLATSEGFFDDVIRELLLNGPDEYNGEFFSDVRAQTDSGDNYLKHKYVVIEYNGPVSVEQANALGLQPTYDSLGNSYMGEVWVCNGRVIRASLEAIEGAYELPYMACVWEKDPNSPFGFGLPIEMEDSQRIHTSTLHMILDNASISSGPMVVFNKEYVEPVDGKWELAPHKLWNVTDSTLVNVDKAWQQFLPANVTPSLMPLLQLAQQWAQEESGINLIAGGMGGAQVGGDSATGMAILQQAATIVTDMKAESWDDYITQKLIDRLYHWNIQYNLRPEYADFDFEVDVRSSTELRNKQIQIANLEKLSVEAAQNPELADHVDQSSMTRARLTMMRLPEMGIIRTPEQVEQIRQERAQQPQPPDPNQVKLEIERSRVEMERERLAFEREKFQFESTKQLQQLRLEEMVNLEQIEARKFDAQSRVLQVQTEREIAMLQLATRSEADRAKVIAQLEKQNMVDETNRFLAGISAAEGASERALMREEMQLKAKTGSGS